MFMIQYLLMIDSSEDQSKFEKLYINYRMDMYTAALLILNNVQDAEDATHQAFVKIAENIEAIDDTIEPKIKGLVITIAEHCAIDLYRKKARRHTVSLDVCNGITIEYEGNNGLTRCMANLPANYRQIILLKCYYGYSSKETAKILGISEANVIKIHQRAKKKLEAMCKEEGIL